MTWLGRDTDVLDTVFKPLVWFVVSLAVVALALSAIGVEAVVRPFASTDPRDAAGVLVMALVTVLARGIGLRIVFGVLDEPVSTGRSRC